MYITICDSVDVALRIKTVDSQKPVRNSLIVVFRGVYRSVKNNQEWGIDLYPRPKQTMTSYWKTWGSTEISDTSNYT